MIDNSFLPDGTLLKRGTYKILSKIDNGGFGVVYKAQNMETGQVVAVKEFFSHEYHTRDSETFSVKSRRGCAAVIREEKDKFNRKLTRLGSLTPITLSKPMSPSKRTIRPIMQWSILKGVV